MTVYRRGKAPEKRLRPPRETMPFFKDQPRRPRNRPEPMNPEAMKILMLSRTPVAGVAVQLRDMINKYTPHVCRAVVGGAGYRDGRRWGPPDALFRDPGAASQLIRWADVVMVHNGTVGRTLSRFLSGRRVLCMYHSEPHRVDRGLERTGVPGYVIAQGHAMLFKNKPVLPNLVDLEDPLLQPNWEPRTGKPILAYAPSNRNSHRMECQRKNPYSSKGYPECEKVLKELAEHVEIKVFEGVPFDRCMQERQSATLMLDEVVTGSYHRCTLEACAQGQIAINGCAPEVLELVEKIAGARPPWVVSSVGKLKLDVLQAITDPDELMVQRRAHREWLEKHWHPKTLLERFYVPAFQAARKL